MGNLGITLSKSKTYLDSTNTSFTSVAARESSTCDEEGINNLLVATIEETTVAMA